MRKIEIDREALELLYWDQKNSLPDIATQLGISPRQVSRRLKQTQITRFRRGSKGELSANWKGGVSKNKSGHILVRQPNHSRANTQGYVHRAILVWEQFYGLPFPKGKIAHHDNEIKDDDRPENIIPLTRSEHVREHNLRRGRKERGKYGGHQP